MVELLHPYGAWDYKYYFPHSKAIDESHIDPCGLKFYADFYKIKAGTSAYFEMPYIRYDLSTVGLTYVKLFRDLIDKILNQGQDWSTALTSLGAPSCPIAYIYPETNRTFYEDKAFEFFCSFIMSDFGGELTALPSDRLCPTEALAYSILPSTSLLRYESIYPDMKSDSKYVDLFAQDSILSVLPSCSLHTYGVQLFTTSGDLLVGAPIDRDSIQWLTLLARGNLFEGARAVYKLHGDIFTDANEISSFHKDNYFVFPVSEGSSFFSVFDSSLNTEAGVISILESGGVYIGSSLAKVWSSVFTGTSFKLNSSSRLVNDYLKVGDQPTDILTASYNGTTINWSGDYFTRFNGASTGWNSTMANLYGDWLNTRSPQGDYPAISPGQFMEVKDASEDLILAVLSTDGFTAWGENLLPFIPGFEDPDIPDPDPEPINVVLSCESGRPRLWRIKDRSLV